MIALNIHSPDNGETCIISRPGVAFYQFPTKKARDLAADLRAFVQLTPGAVRAKIGTHLLIVKTSEMLQLADQLDGFADAHAGRRLNLEGATR